MAFVAVSIHKLVSLKQLASELGMDRSHARRYVLKLGFTPRRCRTSDSGNQLTLALTREEADAIVRQRKDQGFLGNSRPLDIGVGFFYVIQLIPELDPKRIKLGFADDVRARLSQHRTAAPTARLVKSWPCKRAWESTVMDALSSAGCRLILNEVYECENVNDLVAKGDALFSILPKPDSRPGLSEVSPHNTGAPSGAP